MTDMTKSMKEDSSDILCFINDNLEIIPEEIKYKDQSKLIYKKYRDYINDKISEEDIKPTEQGKFIYYSLGSKES